MYLKQKMVKPLVLSTLILKRIMLFNQFPVNNLQVYQNHLKV